MTPARRAATTRAAGAQIPPGMYFASIEIISARNAAGYDSSIPHSPRIRIQPRRRRGSSAERRAAEPEQNEVGVLEIVRGPVDRATSAQPRLTKNDDEQDELDRAEQPAMPDAQLAKSKGGSSSHS